MPKCQGTLAQKKVPYLKIKWLQQDSKPQPLSSWMNTQPFSQTDQMTEWMIDWLIEMNDFLKKIEIHSIQGWTATRRHGVTRKRNTKRHAGNRHTGKA